MHHRDHPNWQKTIILFLTSQCITLFGSTLVQMALVWYAAMETSQGIWVAAFSVCSYLPQFILSFVGGIWADRYPRKLLIIGADALIAFATLVMVCSIPLITSTPTLLSALLAMSAIRSLGAGIQTPAVNAVIPQVVPKEQLMRYNGINASMQAVVNFAAPAAAGVVFAVSSLRTTLMIDIITAVIGSAILSCLTLPDQEKPKESQTLLSDMIAGIRYALNNRSIGKLLTIYGLFTLLCVPAGYLAGLLVRRIFGSTYWYLTAVEVVGFAGMTAGGVVMSTWGGLRKKERTLSAGLFTFGAFAIGMGLTKNFPLYLSLMFFYGITLTVIQTSITTLLQETAEPAMQGRVFGLFSTIYAGALPLGMILFGSLADLVPLQWLMAGSGAALIAIAGIVGVRLQFRNI